MGPCSYEITMTSPAAAPRHRVRPEDFYRSDADKTKLNWLLYEYALEMEAEILDDRDLVAELRAEAGIDGDAIARVCVDYAMSLRREILDRLENRNQAIRIGYEPLEKALPEATDELIDQLLTHAAEAWNSLAEACGECPTHCASEPRAPAPMFDDPDLRD